MSQALTRRLEKDLVFAFRNPTLEHSNKGNRLVDKSTRYLPESAKGPEKHIS